jgi:hypothetical protein
MLIAPRLLRPLFALLLAGPVLAACARSPVPVSAPHSASPPADMSSGDLPPVPICRQELRAYLELTQLAKLHGDDWTVFAPAVEALQQQILDCMGRSRAPYRAL